MESSVCRRSSSRGHLSPLELTRRARRGWISHMVTKRSEREGGARGRTIRERGYHRFRSDGLRRTGRRVLRAALRLFPVLRETHQDAVLRQRYGLADRVADAVRRTVLYLWWDSCRRVKSDENVEADAIRQASPKMSVVIPSVVEGSGGMEGTEIVPPAPRSSTYARMTRSGQGCPRAAWRRPAYGGHNELTTSWAAAASAADGPRENPAPDAAPLHYEM